MCGQVRVVFADLDGTLYPGAHEEGPGLPGFRRNMEAVAKLEKQAVAVIPATGNNICLAWAKFGELRDLRMAPGIYCNGALVKGLGGEEVYCRSLGDCLDQTSGDAATTEGEAAGKLTPNFLDVMVSAWVDALDASEEAGPFAPLLRGGCVLGLGKETALFLDHASYESPESLARDTGAKFQRHMEITSGEWITGEAMRERAAEVLSLVLLLPTGTDSAALLAAQSWLQEQGLLSFASTTQLSNGTPSSRFAVICKHVHVPGIGPEIDMSPAGVNKGAAIRHYLDHVAEEFENDNIAVFGDAGNDLELFGRRRGSDGQLEPLPEFPGFRPALRVAMPWANDDLLLKDATRHAPVHVVLEEISDSLPQQAT